MEILVAALALLQAAWGVTLVMHLRSWHGGPPGPQGPPGHPGPTGMPGSPGRCEGACCAGGQSTVSGRGGAGGGRSR